MAGIMLKGVLKENKTMVTGYDNLRKVFDDCLHEAAEGRGHRRHSIEGEPFEGQTSGIITELLGVSFPLGQAMKKIMESVQLSNEDGVRELIGAINYIALAIIKTEEERN